MAFAGGVVCGLHVGFSSGAISPRRLGFEFIYAGLLLRTGFLLSGSTRSPQPADHIVPLLEAKWVDLTSPLRWHGYLRNDSSRGPWRYSYDLELSSVDYAGEVVRVRGGLWLGLTPR